MQQVGVVNAKWFRQQIEAVKRTLDNSEDTDKALSLILHGVYSRGALDMADGKLGVKETAIAAE
jgi:hypothetical protein